MDKLRSTFLKLFTISLVIALAAGGCYKRQAMNKYRSGRNYMNQDNYRDAYLMFQQALNKTAGREWKFRGEVLYNLAAISVAAQELEQADRYLFRAMDELSPGDANLVDNILDLHQQLRSYQRAEGKFVIRERKASVVGGWDHVLDKIYERVDFGDIKPRNRAYNIQVRYRVGSRGYIRELRVVSTDLQLLAEPVTRVLRNTRFMPAFERNVPVDYRDSREITIVH